WIASGLSKKFVVMRLKDSTMLTKVNLQRMSDFAKSQFGKNYDIYFGWNDNEWYCSELVWKTYYNILSIELALPKALKEFNIDAPIVRKTMVKRYGKNIPYDEKMISPGQLFESKLLYRVQ
ncbi:MAG: peptidoglycan peptidase, partial [Bacteroidetes bacterium]|nr:peptidoglycan peptidase [Bacteroidota bacterium]